MAQPVYTQTRRRLALLFSLPLAFSVLFFCVDLATEHTDIDLLRIQNLNSAVEQLRSLENDVQASERGFLLTGDEHSLIPLEQANVSLPSQIDSCLRYAKDEPQNLQTQVGQLTQLVKKRFDEANQVMKVQKAQGFASAVNLM